MSCLTGSVRPAAGDNRAAAVPAPPLDGQEAALAGQWPLRSFLELGPLTESARRAWQHTAAVLGEWGRGDLQFACELIAGELVSNAARASRAPGLLTPVRIWLCSDKDKVLILVWDASPLPPLRPAAEPDPLAESGRGLYLVGQASEHWSWQDTPGGGKVVWALCGQAFG
jgi:anti-sigma regulatory factor (Ser/Thr protein kinase)